MAKNPWSLGGLGVLVGGDVPTPPSWKPGAHSTEILESDCIRGPGIQGEVTLLTVILISLPSSNSAKEVRGLSHLPQVAELKSSGRDQSYSIKNNLWGLFVTAKEGRG